MFRRVPRPLARFAGAVLRVPTVVPDLGATGTICFISEVDREARAEDLAPFAIRDSTIVYCGIDGRLFTPGDQPKTEAWLGGRLLYVGRYDPRKGIETVDPRPAHGSPAPRWRCRGRATRTSGRGSPASPTRSGSADRVTFGAVERAGLVDRYRAGRRRGVPQRVGGALRARAPRGDGLRHPRARDRRGWLGRVPPRRRELRALPAR